MKTVTLSLVALVLSFQGQANVIYDSTGDGQNQATGLTSSSSLYDSFSNTSASAESITGLQFVLDNFSCGPEANCSATLDVGLYTSDSGAAGAPLGVSPLTTFTLDSGSTPLGSLFTETVTGLDSNPLVPGSRYWIGLSLDSSSTGLVSWEYGSVLTSPTETGQFWEAAASVFGGMCPGGSTASASNCVVPNSDSNTPFEMQVTAGVPEPSTFWLLLSTLSAVGLLAAFHRRRPAHE